MDFNQIAQSAWDQITAVWNAPVPFLGALLASLFVIRSHIKQQFETRLANSESTIALQDRQLQDYKDKLDGATPDAARARIDALEERIEQLWPRRVTGAQRQAMAGILDTFRGTTIQIMSDAASADAAQMSHGLTATFRSAGWHTEGGTVLGLGHPPLSGIAFIVPNPQELSPQQQAVTDALHAAGLEFDLQRGGGGLRLEREGIPDPIGELLLSNRLQD